MDGVDESTPDIIGTVETRFDKDVKSYLVFPEGDAITS